MLLDSGANLVAKDNVGNGEGRSRHGRHDCEDDSRGVADMDVTIVRMTGAWSNKLVGLGRASRMGGGQNPSHMCIDLPRERERKSF